MKFSVKVFAVGLFSTSMIAFASDLSTKWTIKNNSKESLILSCKNISEKDSNIAMVSRSIKPSKTEVFDWGDNYYNDGLWLNAGNWNCTTKNTTKLPAEFENFSTEWGESVSLVVNAIDGKLKLTKVEKKDASIAVKKENNKENSIE
ncbi:hypothetical protein GCL60_10815 [Silvanigrella paludirubra]|uniref:Uncharacterized protein n=1 Tax=Silvanigrella paludirubra TaxID=2499159 RepID=A0A6N6VRM1_9BACT|nr:hypothetical protein [Silvanigrella paludirubra]KAB8037658.1 hypothetical protein GCL60_10815 [Silvanigrella paludirubra]